MVVQRPRSVHSWRPDIPRNGGDRWVVQGVQSRPRSGDSQCEASAAVRILLAAVVGSSDLLAIGAVVLPSRQSVSGWAHRLTPSGGTSSDGVQHPPHIELPYRGVVGCWLSPQRGVMRMREPGDSGWLTRSVGSASLWPLADAESSPKFLPPETGSSRGAGWQGRTMSGGRSHGSERRAS